MRLNFRLADHRLSKEADSIPLLSEARDSFFCLATCSATAWTCQLTVQRLGKWIQQHTIRWNDSHNNDDPGRDECYCFLRLTAVSISQLDAFGLSFRFFSLSLCSGLAIYSTDRQIRLRAKQHSRKEGSLSVNLRFNLQRPKPTQNEGELKRWWLFHDDSSFKLILKLSSR